MTSIQLVTYGGFLICVINKQAMLGVGWLVLMFSGTIPDNDAGLALIILIIFQIYTRIVRY